MKKNQIEFAILTVLHNWREHIITKKQMKKYYEGKIEVDRGLRKGQNRYEESNLDDMESFIANILIGNVKEEDKYYIFIHFLYIFSAKIVRSRGTDDRRQRYRVF